jgi:lysozyme family protein
MIVAGIILLLPGLCSLFFVYAGVATSASDLQFVGACVIVACFGVGLIWWAIRRPRP